MHLCVSPERLLTRCLAEYLIHFHHLSEMKRYNLGSKGQSSRSRWHNICWIRHCTGGGIQHSMSRVELRLPSLHLLHVQPGHEKCFLELLSRSFYRPDIMFTTQPTTWNHINITRKITQICHWYMAVHCRHCLSLIRINPKYPSIVSVPNVQGLCTPSLIWTKYLKQLSVWHTSIGWRTMRPPRKFWYFIIFSACSRSSDELFLKNLWNPFRATSSRSKYHACSADTVKTGHEIGTNLTVK